MFLKVDTGLAANRANVCNATWVYLPLASMFRLHAIEAKC